MILYHGSPYLFDKFQLISLGEGTGLKYGCGIYLTEVLESAVHYSEPRPKGAKNAEVSTNPLFPNHYIYTVEIPDLVEGNHLISPWPVCDEIVNKVEKELGVSVPQNIKAKGKLFRKWVGCTLTGSKTAGIQEEKTAIEFLDRLGVIYNVWGNNPSHPELAKNIAVFNPDNVKIIRIEEIGIERKKVCGSFKWVLAGRKEVTL